MYKCWLYYTSNYINICIVLSYKSMLNRYIAAATTTLIN